MKKLVLISYCFLSILLYAQNEVPYIRVNTSSSITTWPEGETVKIEWESSGIENIIISICPRNLLFFNDESFSQDMDCQVVGQNIEASNGSFNWFIDKQYSSHLIKIQDASNPDIYDYCDGYFYTYDEPSNSNIRIVYPQGGEVFKPGDYFNKVLYKSLNFSRTFQLEFSSNNGSTWESINDTRSMGIDLEQLYSHYTPISFRIPNRVSESCLLRLVDIADGGVLYTIENPFSISNNPQKSIELMTQIGGVSYFYSGNNAKIKWESTGLSTIRIEYCKHDFLATSEQGYLSDPEWKLIANNVDANLGEYSFLPFDDLSNSHIKITSNDDDRVYDISEAQIAVVPKGKINIIYPTGGEVFDSTLKNSKLLMKNISMTQQVIPEISYDNGLNWTDLDNLAYGGLSINPITGHLIPVSFPIPNIESDNCLIRIRDYSNPEIIYDVIKDPFTIRANAPKTLEILSQKGTGDYYEVNSDIKIKWKSKGISKLKIEKAILYSSVFNDTDLQKDFAWVEVANGIDANLGIYTLKADVSLNTHHFKISDVSDSKVYDFSEAPVMIPAGGLDISFISPKGGESFTGSSTFHNIIWKTLNTHAIRGEFQFSSDNGTNWLPIANIYYLGKKLEYSPLPMSLGQLNWEIPQITSANCKLRIIDSNSKIWYTMDKVFSIESSGSNTGQGLGDKTEFISLFPNPAKDYLFVNSDIKIQSINIVDINGKIALSVNNPDNVIPISLNTGMFFVTIVFNNNTTLTEKILVE